MERQGDAGGKLFWTRRVSLTARILAVNVIALALMAGSLFYLDSLRKQLIEERFKLARSEVEITADALAETSGDERRALIARVGTEQKLRLRLYDAKGALLIDSFAIADPAFAFVDPATEPWYQDVARGLDRGVDFLVTAPKIPRYREPAVAGAAAWPEIAAARASSASEVRLRYAPDRTPVINAASPVGARGEMLLATRNARDITQDIRDARQTLAIVVAVALILSVQLSLFLARTIVQPLRALVRAAVRVRLGRERQVVVPRLPERGDEIGMLARAFSDMTGALRQRIDAVESFAADVAHELKNPLASLRSALEALDKVEDPDLRSKLSGIAAHDVRRIDRLITEIADASRIDAELSRASFERIDLALLAARLVQDRDSRAPSGAVRFRFDGPGEAGAIVSGDAARLERAIENLIDNAVSFSPRGGLVRVALSGDGEVVSLVVEDDGPGIPVEEREKVFERFHSVRPDSEDFGAHSGLGLAIARTIVSAHDGRLTIHDRPDGGRGACLVAEFPAA
ncbi:ATP-binding protein [Novosphingobium tardum]|uniref:histidine kinase n=1 Tax=Novosphingobium tardum TaxID=1538021 RepID=A0ABV8RQ47_9SPHN